MSMSTVGTPPFASVITDEAGLRELYREPAKLVAAKKIDHVDEGAAAFIGSAPFVLLATADEHGRLHRVAQGRAARVRARCSTSTGSPSPTRRATTSSTGSATWWSTRTSGCCSSSRAATRPCGSTAGPGPPPIPPCSRRARTGRGRRSSRSGGGAHHVHPLLPLVPPGPGVGRRLVGRAGRPRHDGHVQGPPRLQPPAPTRSRRAWAARPGSPAARRAGHRGWCWHHGGDACPRPFARGDAGAMIRR